MNKTAPIWSDEYTGPRFTYGLTYRPLGYAHVPDGWLIGSDAPHPDFKFGTVQYPAALSDSQISHAELTPLDTARAAENCYAQWSTGMPDTCIGCGTPASTFGARFCKFCRES